MKQRKICPDEEGQRDCCANPTGGPICGGCGTRHEF